MSKEFIRQDTASNKAINLAIFEGLFGAKREQLAGDVCGLTRDGAVHGSFTGHERIDEEAAWAEHYSGPDFCGDLDLMFDAEERLAERGWQRDYAEALVEIVCPHYRELTQSDEVLEFWFAIAHAGPLQRARAAAQLIKQRDVVGLGTQDRARLVRVVERAIELAIAMRAVDGQACAIARAAFGQFVRDLKPDLAEDLIAVMYLGRGDQSTFTAMRRVVVAWASDQHVLAQQMCGKAPLVRYLQDGLTKLRVQLQQ